MNLISSHFRYHCIGVFKDPVAIVNGREWPVKLRVNGGEPQNEVEARLDDVVEYVLPLEGP